MITKQIIVRMSMISADSEATNVYDLDYYRARIKFIDNYQPSKPVTRRKPATHGKLKTDRERVKELQQKNNNSYKNLRS